MLKDDKITYVAPPFESVQHDVTKVDKDNRPLEASFHSDLSLMMRIENMSLNAKTVETIKSALQPMIDNSNFRSEIEDAFGALTDDDLMRSCPSRYLSTASEKAEYLRNLAKEDAEIKQKVSAQQVKDEEDSKRKLEEDELRAELNRYLSNFH